MKAQDIVALKLEPALKECRLHQRRLHSARTRLGGKLPLEAARLTVASAASTLAGLKCSPTRTRCHSPGMLMPSFTRARGNTFEALMEAVKVCSLGQISHALYEVGGEYRRNM